MSGTQHMVVSRVSGYPLKTYEDVQIFSHHPEDDAMRSLWNGQEEMFIVIPINNNTVTIW